MKQRATKKLVRVVTIGGGSGQSRLLWYLKPYPLALTAIVSMVDNGGSTGKLRQQLGVLPPGDIRRCLVALADKQPPAQKLFEHRFIEGDLAEHAVGNLILAGLALRYKDFAKAVKVASRILQIHGQVLPVSVQSAQLYARLANGQVIQGETNIDIPKHNPHFAIKQLYLKPKIKATRSALQALRSADVIVLTIGDLFTSILPNLLVIGVAQAIQRSRARVLYTCNRTTKLGETRGFTALDYIKTIERYLGRPIDGIIVDSTINTDQTTKHLVHYNKTALQQHGVTVYEAKLQSKTDTKEIDGKKLAAYIVKLCQHL